MPLSALGDRRQALLGPDSTPSSHGEADQKSDEADNQRAPWGLALHSL
jgi:hypothetical protein